MFKGGADDRKVLGDATDSGLLRYCDKLAPSSLVRMAYKKVSCCAGLTGSLVVGQAAAG